MRSATGQRVEEGKLSAEEAKRLQALAKRDTGSLAINVLMSFGAVAVAAGIIAPEPIFTTGAALGVVLVAIGLSIFILRCRAMGASRYRHHHYRRAVGGWGHRVR